MKKGLFSAGIWLVSLAGVSFFTLVALKVSEGKLFERYRTFWLYEMDYFSVLVILFFAVIMLPLILLAARIKERRDQEELRRHIQTNKMKVGE